MTRHLVINVDPEDMARRVAVALGAADVAWWHYMASTWLVIDTEGRTTSWWQAHLLRYLPNTYFLVHEVKSKAIGGVVPRSGKGWLTDTWLKEPKEPGK